MSINVNPNRLSDTDYAKLVYMSYLAQDGEYRVDEATIRTIEENYTYHQIQQWKADLNNAEKDSNEYSIENTDDGVDAPGDNTVPPDESANSAVKIKRSQTNDEKNAKFDKIAVLSGGGLAALCGGYVAVTGGMGAGAVAVGSIGVAIVAFTVLAIALKYQLTKPNKDVHEELEIFKKAMMENDVELANAKIKLQESEGKIEILKAEAESTADDVEQELKAKEEELAKKQERIAELNEKAKTEEGLTDEEKAELETLTAEVQVLLDEITALKEGAAEEIEDEENAVEQENTEIEENSAVFKSVSEVAEYVATFDEQAKAAADDEHTAQTMNAALGIGAAAAMQIGILGLTGVGRAAQIAALTGGLISAAGASEQKKFSSDISAEIDVRTTIQNNIKDAVITQEAVETAVDDAVNEADNLITDINNIEIPEGDMQQAVVREEVTLELSPAADNPDDPQEPDDPGMPNRKPEEIV